MFFILIVLVLVLAATCYQVIQGLFSALIMMILSILCALLAFNYYELLAQALYEYQPGYADAASLIVVFVVPLFILRSVFDRVIGGNIVFGVWADRIGGGILGFISAQILVGILVIATQMLPFGPSFLGYQSHGPDLKRQQSLQPFRPDEFTLWMVNSLSKTGLGAKPGRSFNDIHDDLLLEAFCARNDAEHYARVNAPMDSIEVLGVYEPPAEIQVPANEKKTQKREREAKLEAASQVPLNPMLDSTEVQKILIVRVQVDELARNKEKNWYRLPATHFRLVSKTGKSYYPLAYLTAWKKTVTRREAKRRDYGKNYADKAPWKCHCPEVKEEVLQLAGLIVQRPWKSKGGPKKLYIDWVYRLAQDEEPSTLVFRRAARSEIPEEMIEKVWPKRMTDKEQPILKQTGALDHVVIEKKR